MIPRSTNPHVLLESTKIVSRATLNEPEAEDEHPKPDLSMVDEFYRVMKRAVPPVPALNEEKRKRRKTAVKKESITEEPLLFRLISHGPPMHISLEPKPEPCLKVREPEIEDNEIQAEERAQRALAVAVDADWVVKESLKSNRHPSTQSMITAITLPPSVNLTPLMIFYRDKPARRTRPPVDRALLGYPYDARVKPQPLEHHKRSYDCPEVNIDNKREKRRRRRKFKSKIIEHKFWRPDPSIKGKCMGYAMGYTRRWDKSEG